MKYNKSEQDNYIKFLSVCLPEYIKGNIEKVNNFLDNQKLPTIQPDLEKGFLFELERFWVCNTFFKTGLNKLMFDEELYIKNYLDLIENSINSYKLNGTEGLKFHLENTHNKHNIHYKLLSFIEKAVKRSISANKYFESVGQDVILNGKPQKVITSKALFQWMDTDLTYENWLLQLEQFME